jgi:aryl-alcohol dehydrogenase-like predicted oxidoreductase
MSSDIATDQRSNEYRWAPQAAAPNVVGKPVSRVGFGTGGLLRIGSGRERQRVLAAALASGVTHFDTAPIYGFGESERALGRFLVQQRHRVTVTTKFGLQTSGLAAHLAWMQRAGRRVIQWFPTLRRVAVRNTQRLYAPPDFSPTAVRASLEASLRSLRTEYIDFFLAHQANVEALPDLEVLGLLEEMRRAGKILAFGVATEFDWLAPVLEQRPELSRVVQFDSELTTSNVRAFGRDTGQLLITYSFISRAIAVCRQKLQLQPRNELNHLDDDSLGRLLLRAAVLANPHGVVLMQSRSPRRIEDNVRAAASNRNDAAVQRLVELIGPQQ